MNGLRDRLGIIALAMLAAICACTAPGASVGTTTATVTMTAGPGTVYITAPAATNTSAPQETPTPTPTQVALPPTPGMTPTQPYSTMPPHITATPGAGDPKIEFFTVSPEDIDPGGSVTLSWKAIGDRAILYALDPAGNPDGGTNVGVESSATATIDGGRRVPAVYLLTVFLGSQKTSATVQVSVHCPDAWFFGNPPAICPNGGAILSEGASEPFERGRMLWVGAMGTITVLFDKQQPRWKDYQNQWNQGDPESDPGIVPPGGYFQPVRGFGLLWRSKDNVRDRLGWATEPESSYAISYQCDASPGEQNCYMSLPSGEVIQLKLGGSGWKVWTGP